MNKETFELGGGKPRPQYQPRALKCSNCDSPISLYSERTQLIICDACSMRLDCSEAELKALGKETNPSTFSLSIDQNFVWNNHKYKIIGALRSKNSWGEYTENYLLFHPFKGTLWAAKYTDEDGVVEFFISTRTRIVPQEDVFSQREGTRITTADGKKWKRKESYTETITEVMGALPWIAKVGDVSNVVELVSTSHNRQILEAEQSQESKEIEYFISLRLSSRQFYTAMGMSPAQVRQAFPNANLAKNTNNTILILFFFFIFFSPIMGNCGSGGGSYSSGRSYSGGGFSGGK